MLRFPTAGLVPAAALAAGFFALESALRGEPAAAVLASSLVGELRTTAGAQTWERAYRASYLVYFAPCLVPALGAGPAAVRRLLAGFTFLLVVGIILILPPGRWLLFDFVPCFLVASSTFALACLSKHRLAAPALSALTLTASAALAALLTGRHGAFDVTLGAAAGLAAYRLVFWRELEFLEDADPWASVEMRLRDLRNLFIQNSRADWETSYAAGSWNFLDSPSQRARHYVIAGAVADRFAGGTARVLDVGCGFGTLFPLLRERIQSYTGLDLSQEAVKACQKRFEGEAKAAFVQAAFESYTSSEPVDVVILNEVLYYFPLRDAPGLLRKAASMVGRDGIVIVSMNRNFKAGLIWRKLAGSSRPCQSLKATNLETGSYWTINVYRTADILELEGRSHE